MYIISRIKWNKSRKNRILSGFLRFFVPKKPADYRNFAAGKIRHIVCVKNAGLPEYKERKRKL